MTSRGKVVAVSISDSHRFSKDPIESIEIEAGIGVVGDCHAGVTVKHRSRVRRDPSQPNLRQVHLIHQELFAEVAEYGHTVTAGDLGENITTSGIDLLALPTDTRLHVGESVVLRITGLRNPCSQIEDFSPGLLQHMVRKLPDGSLERKAGVMSVVERGGRVRPGDSIDVVLPAGEHIPLAPV